MNPRAASIPGEDFSVRVHTFSATSSAQCSRTWFETTTAHHGPKSELPARPALRVSQRALSPARPRRRRTHRALFHPPHHRAALLRHRNEAWRERSFAPYPLSAWAEFTFDGVPIRLGMVVQTLARVTGVGGVYQPLVVTPAIGVRVEPEARILPLDGSRACPCQRAPSTPSAPPTEPSISSCPKAGAPIPRSRSFHLKSAGDTEPLVFSVTPAGDVAARAYTIQAVAHVGGKDYSIGWQSIGYTGLRPYNQYKPAELRTRKVDVKLAPGLRVGYVMGTGDMVPEAIEALGITPHLLTERRARHRRSLAVERDLSSAFAPTPRGPSSPPPSRALKTSSSAAEHSSCSTRAATFPRRCRSR